MRYFHVSSEIQWTHFILHTHIRPKRSKGSGGKTQCKICDFLKSKKQKSLCHILEILNKNYHKFFLAIMMHERFVRYQSYVLLCSEIIKSLTWLGTPRFESSLQNVQISLSRKAKKTTERTSKKNHGTIQILPLGARYSFGCFAKLIQGQQKVPGRCVHSLT